jgi:hypothetical protein
MTHHDPRVLARELTNEQFELLLRYRIEAEREALGPKAPRNISFTYERDEGAWRIGNSYDDGFTKGELLHDCIAECNHRLGFVAMSKLRLLEAPPAAPVDDEIPF